MEKVKEKSELLEWVMVIGIAVLLAFGARFFLFDPVVVKGASMMPTLEDGDKVVVSKIGPKFTDYDRFDVIVFEANEDENYVKRIIGVPGDHIKYENDKLLINGKNYEEDYLEDYRKSLIDNGTLTEDFTLEAYLDEATVPDDHFFVLGDNRRGSKDSRDRQIGFIPKAKVIGSAEFVYYPFNHFKVIK